MNLNKGSKSHKTGGYSVCGGAHSLLHCFMNKLTFTSNCRLHKTKSAQWVVDAEGAQGALDCRC